jgi:hypothetical protein
VRELGNEPLPYWPLAPQRDTSPAARGSGVHDRKLPMARGGGELHRVLGTNARHAPTSRRRVDVGVAWGQNINKCRKRLQTKKNLCYDNRSQGTRSDIRKNRKNRKFPVFKGMRTGTRLRFQIVKS